MEGIAKAHLQEYGASPAVVIEVPQVTTLLGAFSEYCHGYAIMGTNSHGLRVAMSPRQDSSVRVFNASSGTERKKFQLTAIRQRKEDKWGQVVKAVCQNIMAAGLGISGFDMTFKGQSAEADPPALTGALVVGMMMALNELYGLGCDKGEMIRLSYGANRFTDVYSSRLRDLITIFTAEPGKVIFFDLETYDYKFIDYAFTKGSGVGSFFIDCGLPSEELAEEVAFFRESCEEAREAGKSLASNGERIRDLSEWDIRHQHIPLSQDLRNAISFIVEESGYALKAADAIRSANPTAFGKLIAAEQRNLSELAGLTSPEVDWLVRRGVEVPGVKGITEISCGITGTLIALIDDGSEDGYLRQIEEYERIFGFKPLIREFVPSGSIKAVSIDDDPSI